MFERANQAEDTDVFTLTKKWALRRTMRVWAETQTTSTNQVAKEDLSLAGTQSMNQNLAATSALYLTRHQTKGRGRGINSWTDQDSSSLLSSWVFSVTQAPQPILSPLVGLALFEACRDTWPEVSFNLKAPNDLFIEDKKVAGLLIEIVERGKERDVIVGLGFNVNSSPSELSTATSLASHSQDLISEEKWTEFLDSWFAHLKAAMHEGLRDMLNPSACERLKAALNLHPMLKEPILRVDELGQLHSSSRVIHWHEL